MNQPTLAQLKRDLVGFRKAAKWKSKIGPAEDAQALWSKVESIQAQIKDAKAREESSQP